jgi:hypothetical protein
MRKKDEPIMNFLKKLEFKKEGLDVTFTFTFDENPYFKNQVLTKKIFMKDEDTPLKSEGTEI